MLCCGHVGRGKETELDGMRGRSRPMTMMDLERDAGAGTACPDADGGCSFFLATVLACLSA